MRTRLNMLTFFHFRYFWVCLVDKECRQWFRGRAVIVGRH